MPPVRDPLDPRVAPDRDLPNVAVPPAPRAHAAAFPRAARMTTPAEFDRCLRRPPAYRNGAFALHLHWIDGDPADPVWRLGLVVPKRYEATAVGRNTVKRRWRDAFRRGRGAWAGEFGSADLVVRLQSPLVPKPKTVVRGAKGAVATAAATALPAPTTAKRRARERFDPSQVFDGLVGRLRSRGGRPPSVGEGGA